MGSMGPRLKNLRLRRKLSGRALATYLGISNAHVSDIENGKSKPSLELLVQIAEYFDCSADYLLGLTDDPAPAGEASAIQGLFNRLSAGRQQDLLNMAENWLADESAEYRLEWITNMVHQLGDIPEVTQHARSLIDALQDQAEEEAGEGEA